MTPPEGDPGSPALRGGLTLVEVSRGLVVARDVERACAWLARLRGWIGRRRIPDDGGLWLPGTRAVHTAGLRTSIDVLFLDRTGTVLGLRRRLAPWRIACGPPGTVAVVELAPGRAARMGLRVGQRLTLRPAVAYRSDASG